MSNMLRGSRRSYTLELQKRNHKRELVLKALEKRQKDQTSDRLLADIIAAVPRSTDRHIDEVIKKVRTENETDAIRLEAALASCRDLHENLSGAKPNVLWTDPVRMIWLETIEAVTAQTSRWKACPLVMIHPYVGSVEVLISLCGKHQAQSEFSRMRLFAEDLRQGLDEILNEIHPIKDDSTGHSLPFEETKEILLNISGQAAENGRLSEDEELSENDNNSVDYEQVIERVSGDWTMDKVDNKNVKEPMMKSRLISSPRKSPRKSTPPDQQPLEVMSLASTSPTTTNQDQPRSPMSDLESPLATIASTMKNQHQRLVPMWPTAGASEPVPPSEPMPPARTRSRSRTSSVNRSLFPDQFPDHSLFPDRLVTYTPPASWQTTIQSTEPEQESSPPSPARSTRAPSDLTVTSEAYPNGYTVIPLKNKNKKSDGRKAKEQKKRPVSSPNLPSQKQSRMDRTELAIEQIQMNQANQNEILQKLASQLGQFSVALAMQKSNLDPK